MAHGKQGRMTDSCRWGVVVALALCAGASANSQLPASDDWKFDIIYLKTGGKLSGLVVKDSPAAVVFWRVNRKPGASTGVIAATIERREIDHIEALEEKDREILSTRLKALDPTGRGEVRRMASLTLATGNWGKSGKEQAKVYHSEHFVLESNAA